MEEGTQAEHYSNFGNLFDKFIFFPYYHVSLWLFINFFFFFLI